MSTDVAETSVGPVRGPRVWRAAVELFRRSRELRVVVRAAQVVVLVVALGIIAEDCSAQQTASPTSRPDIAMGTSRFGNVTSGPAGPAAGVNGWTAPTGWDFVEGGLGATAFAPVVATQANQLTTDSRFVVSADIAAVNGVAGIVIGYRDEKNYVRLVVNRLFGAVALEQVTNGVAASIQTYGPVPSEGEIRLTAAVQRGRLTGYLGGQPVLGASIEPAGSVGLTAVSGTATFAEFYLGTW